MINFDCIATLLSSILSRINLVSFCLPDCLQEDIDEIKLDITSVLREHKYNVNLSTVSSSFSMDMSNLYKMLNNISRDLDTCLQFISDEYLEDAAGSVKYIIINMAHIDSEFECYYNNAKKKVRK